MAISKFTAGALHENHKALIAAGPWDFGGIEPARYEALPGGGERPVCAGCCDICGQSICDVVRLRHRVTGEMRMLGLDCASTFDMNLGKAFRDAKTGLLKIKREATTRRKAEKLAVVLAPLRAEMTAWAAEDSFRANVARNAIRVMDKGRRPSPEHMALIEKCRAQGPQRGFERRERPARVEEQHVPAPEGKQTIRGVVVSTKSEDKMFGRQVTPTYRMTVKVTTDDGGVYFVNGTAPRALLDAAWERLECPEGALPALRGCVVEFTATLTRSDRDEHFAFADRPSKARLVEWPAGAERQERRGERSLDGDVDPFAAFGVAAE
jgi:hypothetical protein